MRLKRLTLHGFKSFADRTALDFNHGITGIVGPNGCGKSNVVDAFKWVLGEQSAKSLRGQQMQDVIFNGSANRKSMGMAEVGLTFETDGQLGDYGSEVVIARRLYRSGQSEYLINNKPCRLRDIRDLFLDTGVGVDAYSLIEQGKVDLLLQASNQDRRAVLEEAAGISKYKLRRKEAQRRLENVQQNLLRAGDVIAEVEKHLRSVKLQAGKARNYQEYVTRLQSLKSQYYLAEYHGLLEQQGTLRVELDDRHRELRELQERHELLEAKRSQFDLEMVELGNQIGAVENKLTQSSEQIDSGQQTIRLLGQRMDEQNESLNASRKRLQAQYLQMGRLREQSKVAGELEAIQGEEASLQEKIRKLQEQIEAHDLRTTELVHMLEGEKSSLIELMRRTAQCNNQLSQIDAEQRGIEGQRQRLTSRREYLAGEKAKIQAFRDDRHQALAELDRQIEALSAEVSRLQDRAEVLDQQSGELSRSLAERKEKRSALQSRQEVLSDMQAQMQGVGTGAKALLVRKDQGDPAMEGLVGLAADLIGTDLEHARLIEAALAGRDQYLVVESHRFVEANRELLAELSGAVSIFPLDSLAPVVNVRDFSGKDGVVATAASLVKSEDRFDHLVRLLLGKTLIVEDLGTAFRLAGEDAAGWRFVTREGEVVEADGSVRVGPTKGGAGLISRKSELEHLSNQLTRLDAEITEAERNVRQVNEDQRQTKQEVSDLRASLYENRTRRVKDQTQLSGLDEQWRKLSEEEPLIESELDSLSQQSAFNAERKEGLERQVGEMEGEQRSVQQRVEELQSVQESEQAARSGLSGQMTELKVEAGRLSQKRQALTDRANGLRRDLQQALAGHQSAGEEIRSMKVRIEQAERQILGTEARLAGLYSSRQEYQRQSGLLRQQRKGKSTQLEQIMAEAHEAKSQVGSLQEQGQELALKINELTVRQETLIQRAQDELRIDLEHAYSDYHDSGEQDWAALEGEINDLKGKISRLGNVNLDAIAEQEQLEARLVFLSSQRDDLDEAQKKLQELIERLDEESQKRFLETFETVRENFQDLYRKLFGGGKADLVLDNPEDVLESGIDILARPPGKETRSVSLLSGGEKTLTTVALLMAIFKSKPSPFCILDEVDAALDEANVDRFNMVIQEFLHHSQFIVITHNKRTMSYADVLYGITMQDAGVSKKVGVKFDKGQGEPEPTEEQEAA